MKRLDRNDPLLAAVYHHCDDQTAFAALPEPAITFLLALAQLLNARRVFEFGSGKSTEAFVKAGLAVTCLEDSETWLHATLAVIPSHSQSLITTSVAPFEICWCGGVPMKGWRLSTDCDQALREAELVLIDSPFYASFREYALMQALERTDGVVVLDDTRIPTLARFCDRLATSNPFLIHRRVAVGHGFDLFQNPERQPVRLTRGPIEWAKCWRRFLLRPGKS